MNISIDMESRENETNSGPANDDLLRFESHRLSTFRNWPNSKVGAEKIAKAGFFYTGCYLEVNKRLLVFPTTQLKMITYF